ncbi:hypothetical protein Tco_0681894 [Tanacetum coccineum]|uniref:Uncharacterized protein n=1 Tax=Tanacetum coccineum TaxID=301880 RepID=A0ABQ4XR92_9ASTR
MIKKSTKGEKIYPPESFYIDFNEDGLAIGPTRGRFASWFSLELKSRISYHLEWDKVTEAMKDQLWLSTKETWNIPNDNAKVTQLRMANDLFRKFKNNLVTNYVNKNRLPFEDYKFLDDCDWEDFVAFQRSKVFLDKSAKAKASANQNKDPARVGRSGYLGKEAQWKEEMAETCTCLKWLARKSSIPVQFSIPESSLRTPRAIVVIKRTRKGYVFDSDNRDKKKTHNSFYLSKRVERAFDNSFKWTMLECNQQVAFWECGYYVMKFVFETLYIKQKTFPHQLHDSTRALRKDELDGWIMNAGSNYHIIGSRQQKFLVLKFFDVKEQQGKFTKKDKWFYKGIRMASMIQGLNIKKDDGILYKRQGSSKLFEGFKQLGSGVENERTRNMGFNESGEYKKTFIGSDVAGSQEVQTQDLIYYHLARDRDQHSTHELFSYREVGNEAAFAVVAVDKIYAHESLTFNNTVACEVISKWKIGLKDDMDAQSDAEIRATKVLQQEVVQTLLEGHSILSLEASLSGDCDVEKNGKWSCIYAVGSQKYQDFSTKFYNSLGSVPNRCSVV